MVGTRLLSLSHISMGIHPKEMKSFELVEMPRETVHTTNDHWRMRKSIGKIISPSRQIHHFSRRAPANTYKRRRKMSNQSKWSELSTRIVITLTAHNTTGTAISIKLWNSNKSKWNINGRRRAKQNQSKNKKKTNEPAEGKKRRKRKTRNVLNQLQRKAFL